MDYFPCKNSFGSVSSGEGQNFSLSHSTPITGRISAAKTYRPSVSKSLFIGRNPSTVLNRLNKRSRLQRSRNERGLP